MTRRNPFPSYPCEQVHVGATIPPDAVEFGRAMHDWIRANRRQPTARDILAVVRSLGYERGPTPDVVSFDGKRKG